MPSHQEPQLRPLGGCGGGLLIHTSKGSHDAETRTGSFLFTVNSKGSHDPETGTGSILFTVNSKGSNDAESGTGSILFTVNSRLYQLCPLAHPGALPIVF